jgi:signal transduction histidine kinase
MQDSTASRTSREGVPEAALRSRRDLEIAGAVAHALLSAATPLEVYRLAVSRLTPLLNASFSSVFLRDAAEPDLLKIECACNWPQSSARYMSRLRIRVASGPTGRAVAERQIVELEDVFDEAELQDWWEPARELGFTSLIALPLLVRGEAVGAVTFYFASPHAFGDDERELLTLIADQLALAAERAQLLETLRLASERMTRQSQELLGRVREADEARRSRQEFLANVSHELRTPLTSIMGYIYLLAASHAGPVTDAQATALSRVEKSAADLLRLIDDLLDLTRVKLGQLQVLRTPVDAVALARQTIAAAANPRGIVLSLVGREPEIPVHTDGEKVSRILGHLVGNALKFTHAGSVTVTVRRDGPPVPLAGAATDSERPNAESPVGGWVVWEVRDTGIGIRAEDLASIFDDLQQLDGSSTRAYGGTGLGLSLSRRLAHLLNGEISASSQPGAGSIFRLHLPLL